MECQHFFLLLPDRKSRHLFTLALRYIPGIAVIPKSHRLSDGRAWVQFCLVYQPPLQGYLPRNKHSHSDIELFTTSDKS